MVQSVQHVTVCAQSSRRLGYRYAKRGIDIVLSALALLITSPFYPIIALLIRLSSPGPIIFKWKVVGQFGKPFLGYKFRTMVQNAEALREELSAHNVRHGPAFKMKNDPRVTGVGRLLRRYSIDELPQLWSILKGDMSLVGPRPLQGHEWRQCTDHQKQRALVKPGAVSLWHVGGQPPRFDDWIELDLKYIANQSLLLDILILLKAVSYIISGKNS